MAPARFLGGLLGSLLIALLSLAAGNAASERWPAVPGLTVAALIIVAVEAAWTRREALEERVSVRLALAGTGVFCGLLALVPLTRWLDGYADYTASFGYAIALPIVVTLFAVPASGFARRVGVSDRALAGLRSLAVAVTVVAALLVARAVPRAVQLPAPAACGDLFEHVARVPASALAGRSEWDARAWRTSEIEGGKLSTQCNPHGLCTARLGAPERPGWPRAGLDFRSDASLDLRHDRASDRWVLATSGGLVGRSCALYQGPEMVPMHLRASDLAASSAPPRGWIAGAAFGVIVALVALARGTRVRRRLAALATAASGRVDAQGWLHLADGGDPLRVPGGIDVRGPVLVRFAAPRRGPAYRSADPRRIEEIVPGKPRPLLREMRLRAAFHDALALGAVVLLGAPLGAAAWVGFLG